MYSSSNSFLGGTNSARPGQPQPSPFGQQQQQGFSQFSQTQQQFGLAPQPTGFPGGQLQPQFTGFPAGNQGLQPPQQQQQGGWQNYGQAPQQQQQPQLQPPQQPHLQPQFTGFPTSTPQPPPSSQQPVPTLQLPTSSAPTTSPGKTSSEIAQSFQDVDGAGRSQQTQSKPHSRIPNIRLSFITAQDQAKFEQLFKAAAGDSQTLDGMCRNSPGVGCYRGRVG